VETNRVNEHGRPRRERHGSQQHWHKPQTLRKRDQTGGTRLKVPSIVAWWWRGKGGTQSRSPFT